MPQWHPPPPLAQAPAAKYGHLNGVLGVLLVRRLWRRRRLTRRLRHHATADDLRRLP